MLGVGVGALSVIAVALLVGAFVQGVVGLGLGLIAAPVVALVEPSLLPGSLLMLSMLMCVLSLWREHSDVHWFGFGWSLTPLLIGTVVGVWLVARLNDRTLSIAVGLMVLLAVAVSTRKVGIPITRGTLSGAGFLSGVTGTATSIAGPPIAVLYQHRPPPEVRSTLAVYFLVGASLSLVGLALTGELSWDEVLLALLMAPMVVVGALLSGLLRSRFAGPAFRVVVLGVCVLSAVVLLARAVLG